MQTTTSTPAGAEYLSDALGFLKAGYPNYKPGKTDWEATRARYSKALGHYPRGAVNLAVERAPKVFLEFFPTLGQLQEVFRDAYKTHLAAEEIRASERVLRLKGAVAGDKRRPHNCPAEQLARLWEGENAYYAPRGGVPEAMARRRASDLARIVDKIGAGEGCEV